MSADNCFTQAHALLNEGAPRLGLYYSPLHDCYFLVSPDETTALPMPRDITGHLNELAKPEADRLNCYAGFVPWPLGGKDGT